jgi:Arc/MetJ-type ribon-helix-helix transcriptional regulator
MLLIFDVYSMKVVTIKLPEAQIDGLEELVGMEMYLSRSATIRAAIRDMLRNELWTPRLTAFDEPSSTT